MDEKKHALPPRPSRRRVLLSRDPAGNPAERFQKAKRREIKSPCHAFTHSRDFIRASSECHQAEASSCSCHSYRSAAMASALQAVGSGKMRGTAPAQQGPPRNPPPSSTNLNCQTKDTFSKSAKYSPSFQALPIEDGTKPRKACNETVRPLSHAPKTGMAERAKRKAVRRRGSVL